MTPAKQRTAELFDSQPNDGAREQIGEQAYVLRGFALPFVAELLPALEAVQATAPLRHMETPGGFTMSVALTNAGELGWTTDRRGYRYATQDPVSGQPWPAMPDSFQRLARSAAEAAGFADFEPDASLINRYAPGARLSLHQDKDERDHEHPVVSVSLGIPAVFLWGGMKRTDKAARIPLFHGDAVVWGGVDRLRYHGVAPLKAAIHPLLGEQRINITFRKAG
jgi:alkylated DNA repair protein (DNA oxidative demethylase)